MTVIAPLTIIIGPVQTISVASITLSNSSIVAGQPTGTPVGNITVKMSDSSTFTGTLTVGGTNAASFTIVSAQLRTVGILSNSSYNITITATQGTATLSTPFQITTTIPATTIQYILTSAPTASGPFTTVAGSPFSSMTDTISGLTAGQTLFFQIQAHDTVFNVFGPVTTVGPITTTGGAPESPAGTRLTNTTGQIVDSALALWSLTGAPLQVLHPNGTVDGSSVTALLYFNHQIFRDDNTGWSSWSGSAWTDIINDPSVTPTESASGTQVTTITYQTAFIYDQSLGSWQLNGLGTTTLQVVHNGSTDNTTANIILLLYWNHQVYRENSSSVWFVWGGSSWTLTTDPRQNLGQETPDDTIITDTTGVIIDKTLAQWTLSNTGTPFQVARNGVVDGTTAGITLLLYWAHTVFQTSTFGSGLSTPGWWSWNGSAWTPVNGDPRNAVATWSLTDKSTGIVLSNNNLTMTTPAAGTITLSSSAHTTNSVTLSWNAPTASGSKSIRSSLGYLTGSFYFEVTCNNLTTDYVIGIASSAYNLQAPLRLGRDPTGVGFCPISPPQSIFTGNSLTAASNGVGVDVNGDVIGCAVNFTSKLIWFTSPVMQRNGFAWNNITGSNPSTGVGGISFSTIGAGPYFVTVNDDIGGAVATVNFGASLFKQIIPTGFLAWASGGTTPPVVNNTTFDDEFVTLSLYNTRNTAAGGTWQPANWYAPDGEVFEGGWLLNPFNPATNVTSVYVQNLLTGMANIGVVNTPTLLLSAAGGQTFMEGQLTTKPSFSQLYGYFEASIACDNVQGLDVQFKLLNGDTFPPQIDIIEILFDYLNTGTWIGLSTAYDNTTLAQIATRYTFDPESSITNFDPTVFHTYGVNWQSDFITWYWDRVQVLQIPTPPGYNTPMFPHLENCAGDGSFAPVIANTTLLPAYMKVDYVRIWQNLPF